MVITADRGELSTVFAFSGNCCYPTRPNPATGDGAFDGEGKDKRSIRPSGNGLAYDSCPRLRGERGTSSVKRANNINPAILLWARQTAGLELKEAADRLGFINPTDAQSPAERLLAFERGERMPTRNQLLKIAAVYRRPILAFYMKQPPEKGDRGEDFRQTAGSVSRRENSLLDALLRDIRARQQMVKSLLEDEDEHRALPYVGSAGIDQRAEVVAASIAATLQFDHQRRDARRGGADALFKTLRGRAESAGVFVLLVGDLGSHHTALGVEVFRGFAISDRTAPFVVINDQDARSARSFTLIHELAHIWLDQSGVSGAPSPDTPRSLQDRIERFCNDVAGEFLLPSDALGTMPEWPDAGNKQSAADFIRTLADDWSISEPMVAYRLNRTGHVDTAIYRELMADYTARWQRLRKRQRERYRDSEGGPNPHVVKRSKLGNALLDVVRRTMRDNTLTHTKAAKLLGVKPGSVESLLRGYEQHRGSMIQGAE